MTQDTRPFWQRPLPPIRRPGDDPLVEREDQDPLAIPSSNGTVDPLADDPLAETPASEVVIRPVSDAAVPPFSPAVPPTNSNGAAPADGRGDLPSPQARSVASLQRELVASQLRCARATEAQGLCRGKVALALATFQRVAMVAQSPSDLIRQHIENENQLRADRVAGKIPQRGGQRRLGSAIDSFAYHTRAMGRGAGGGGAFRCGAKPASARTPK